MTRSALIGDIGGTNARFALVTPGTFEPREVLSLPCADYPGLIEAVHDYLSRVGLTGDAAPREACLALAGPIHRDRVSMTNNHWTFSREAVRQTLGLSLFKTINDFTAQALSVPHLADDDLLEIQRGEAIPHAAQLVIGPGTGLGVAGLFPGLHGWIALPTEGGHVAFAPTDECEQNLLRHFRNRYGRVSVERILSGQGLLDLYLAHCSLKGAPPTLASSAEVTQAAENGNGIARDTLLRFLKILGDVSGDAALSLGAQGGVILCGGILPRLFDWLPESRFLEAFTAKGRMAGYTAAIPVHLVTASWPGVLGAAEALHNQEVI